MATMTALARRTRSMMVEAPGSLGERARQRRWTLFREAFPMYRDMRIVDLGGTVESWLRAPEPPAHVTVVNLVPSQSPAPEWVTVVVGDACEAVAALRRAGQEPAADLVYCNSVMEHVGGHANRLRLAASIHAMSSRHWVQTPYRYFPVEPHQLFPGFQFLPVAARARVAASWKLAHIPAQSVEKAYDSVLWTELLSKAEMRVYFPNSQLVTEKVAGLTKSIIALAK